MGKRTIKNADKILEKIDKIGSLDEARSQILLLLTQFTSEMEQKIASIDQADTVKNEISSSISSLLAQVEEKISKIDCAISNNSSVLANKIDEKAQLVFSDYVSRSFLGVISNLNCPFNNSFLNKLVNEIDNIIKADLPIKRHKLDKEEVLEIYKSEGYVDKYNVLQYREADEVNYYSCDGYINYMYDYMLPSTVYLNKFIIKMHYPGFIVQYPRAEFNGEIPPFQDDISFSKMIKDARDWRKLCGVDNIASMNKFIDDKDIVRFINMCETKHNNMLAELGLKIKENIENIRLIAVAGPSSSGKTTFTNRLKIELMTRGIDPVMISMDDYYLDREKTPLDENGKPDFESIYALDIELFNQQLLDLIQGEKVQLPYFDFNFFSEPSYNILPLPINIILLASVSISVISCVVRITGTFLSLLIFQ